MLLRLEDIHNLAFQRLVNPLNEREEVRHLFKHA